LPPDKAPTLGAYFSRIAADAHSLLRCCSDVTLVAYNPDVPIDRDDQNEREARLDQLLERSRAKVKMNESVTVRDRHTVKQAKAQIDPGRKAERGRGDEGKK
jgi:hypothetical protein